ncbi:CAF17-like 4Fe-4S cluster assembly/insertion protein YgfZ [Rhizobium sp. C1]|uniref:CAF17-like 4Fe-4S cluster assembly/insertion protein YgfZ n=1 Tax=Rhizobium sp. C1 TaxID=1349799 RepID=UPI001E53D007|nr:folate-binding protein YgfZ [Rhizobium sp. C1]MCD2177573.1 folate-binding protein YgfZ [Rhizobium sp. C1]
MARAFLATRGWLTVSGPDASDFLQGLITTDLDSLEPGVAAPGALLTPQGKIMFFFMISKSDSGFLVETDAGSLDALIKRLTMYKLRAKVDLAKLEATGATVVWDEMQPEGSTKDIRFAKAGMDLYRLPGGSGICEGYDALRAQAGVPEAGVDFPLQDAFPHDVLLDKSGGVSFKKGCYVGQEVVSRMQHRSTARRRLVTVAAESALPASGTEIRTGGKIIGALGTVADKAGLAIIRIDRAGAAMAAGTPILAGETPLTVRLPAWSGLEFITAEGED